MILNLVLGIIVGAFVVGSSVVRTISVNDCNIKTVIYSSCINSITYYMSIKFVAKDNDIAYIGTSIGSVLVCLYLVNNKKKENDK